MQNSLLSIKQIKQIKSIRAKNRTKKYKQAVVWGKTKRIFTRWKNNFLFTPYVVTKHFRIGQKKISFPQRKIARRAFILKENLRLNLVLSSYNLIINIKGHEAYLQVKEALEFSQLGLLTFDFWHLSKLWVKYLFNQNSQNANLQKFLNGSLLVIKTQTLTELLETLDLFSNFLELVTPVGFFFSQRFFWISHGLELFSGFFENVEALQSKVSKKSSNFFLLFPGLFQFLNFMLYRTLFNIMAFRFEDQK